MGSVRWRSEEGQTLGEYAILAAGIAVACALVVLVVSGSVGGWFDSSAKPITPGGALRPPTSTAVEPPKAEPQTEENCTTDPGYAAYGYPTLDDCLAALPSQP
jgi:Flp pilus assembly pilin Flp